VLSLESAQAHWSESNKYIVNVLHAVSVRISFTVAQFTNETYNWCSVTIANANSICYVKCRLRCSTEIISVLYNTLIILTCKNVCNTNFVKVFRLTIVKIKIQLEWSQIQSILSKQ